MSRHPALVPPAIAGALLLAGCGPKDEAKAPVVRPVLSVVVDSGSATQAAFTGTIQPRYETDRGFQVLGRIITRLVNVGDLVKAGQKLAENEPLTYRLAVRSAEADLARVQAELDRAAAAQKRVAILVSRTVSPRSDLDTADQVLEAAAASVRQAQANLVKQRENLRYTTLLADEDGVVTQVYADVGQTASPGMKVMTIARTDVREAVVDLPEDVVRVLRTGSPFEVALLADRSVTSPGAVREIAPQADAATRTRRVRITLERLVDPFRLGSTVTASPRVAADASSLKVPATAILERDGRTFVWVVDTAAKTVRSVPVAIAGREGDAVRIASGLDRGARIVTAGTRSLTDGLRIALEQGAAR